MNDALGFKQRVVAIIQARMGSERLPGKMMMDLGGKPLLAHVINRLQLCKTLSGIVVATPDEEIARFAYNFGNCVLGYQDTGDPNNVLLRYIKAAGWCNAQIVVRITGDCALLDPKLVDICVKAYVESNCDIATNVLRRTFPKGMDVEVLHYNTLKRIYHLTKDPRYLEHVTLYCYEHPSLFVFESISQKRDYSYIQTSIDTQQDLDIAKIVLSRLPVEFGHLDVARSYEELLDGWRQHILVSA